jgi:phosphatidylserine synthase
MYRPRLIPSTGNTIFLALGASGQPNGQPLKWLKSLVSISVFFLGCFTFSNTRFIKPKARGTLAASFVIQALCIIVAAILTQTHVVPEPVGTYVDDKVNLLELLPLGFLAFQSGGQIVTSRILGFNEVPTTVLTSVYCDIASDPKLIKADNVKRNRRVAAVLCILIGGICGGWISRSSAGLATVLWIAAGIKLSIALGWSLWKPKQAIQL